MTTEINTLWNKAIVIFEDYGDYEIEVHRIDMFTHPHAWREAKAYMREHKGCYARECTFNACGEYF